MKVVLIANGITQPQVYTVLRRRDWAPVLKAAAGPVQSEIHITGMPVSLGEIDAVLRLTSLLNSCEVAGVETTQSLKLTVAEHIQFVDDMSEDEIDLVSAKI